MFVYNLCVPSKGYIGNCQITILNGLCYQAFLFLFGILKFVSYLISVGTFALCVQMSLTSETSLFFVLCICLYVYRDFRAYEETSHMNGNPTELLVTIVRIWDFFGHGSKSLL